MLVLNTWTGQGYRHCRGPHGPTTHTYTVHTLRGTTLIRVRNALIDCRHTHTHTHLHTHTEKNIFTCTHSIPTYAACPHAQTYTRMHTHPHTHTERTSSHAHTHTHICVPSFLNIHTRAHTSTHTHALRGMHSRAHLLHTHTLGGSMVLSPPCTGTEMWGKCFNSQTRKTASLIFLHQRVRGFADRPPARSYLLPPWL